MFNCGHDFCCSKPKSYRDLTRIFSNGNRENRDFMGVIYIEKIMFRGSTGLECEAGSNKVGLHMLTTV